MQQSERSSSDTGAMQTTLAGWQRQIWTAIPAIVVSYEGDNTVTCQPAIKAVILQQTPSTGKQEEKTVNLPQLIKVPVVQFGAGGFCMDVQPSEGDEVLIVFSARCIDAWWQSGGVQEQIERRAHDLSDGIAIPGLWSVPRVPAGIGAGGIKIRSTDGACFVHVKAGHVVDIVAPGGVTIEGNVTITGNITSTGTVTNNGHDIGSTHKHIDTQPGGGLSGVPQ